MAISGNTGLSTAQFVAFINALNLPNIFAEKKGTYGFNILLFRGIEFGIGAIFSRLSTGSTDLVMYYNNGESSVSKTSTGAAQEQWTFDVYSSSKGILFECGGTLGSATSKAKGFIAINDDNTVVYGCTEYNTFVSVSVARYTDENVQTIAYTANAANSTSLCNFVAKGDIGTDSSAQYAFFMPIYQYNSVGILTGDGIDYITNGYWCIQD